MHVQRILLGTGLVALSGAAGSAHAMEIQMPFRGDATQNAQTYYTTSGHLNYNCGPSVSPSARVCEIDFGMQRWDSSAGAWTSQPESPSSYGPANMIWGEPLYAPVDGEVVSCWRNMPDDDLEGDDIRCPGGGENLADEHMCARRGNHLVIRTDDDELISIAHLQEGSVPQSLCPHNDTYLYTDSSVSCHFYDDARVANPIRVSKGAYIGNVGNSGAGTGPHLHLEAYADSGTPSQPCRGNDLPLEFSESWVTPRGNNPIDPSAWSRLKTDRLPIDGSTLAIWPDPLGPRIDTVVLEEGSRPAIASTNAGGVVAFRNQGGGLSTLAYTPASNGELLLGPEATAGSISRVDVAKVTAGSRNVVVAVRNGQGRLQLLPYYVSSSRTLTRGTGVTRGPVSELALTRAPTHRGVVSAIRNSVGTLSVLDFGVQQSGTNLTVTSNGSATSNAPIRSVAVDRITAGRARNQSSGAFRGVVTAERRNDHRLVVRTWSVSSSGSVSLADSHLATWGGQPLLVDNVSVAVVGNGTREFVTVSVRERYSDELRVQSYEVRTNGDLTYVQGRAAGSIGAVTSAPSGSSDVIVGMQDSVDDLLGISFEVKRHTSGSTGGHLRRIGTRQAGTIDALDIGVRGSREDAVFVVVDDDDEIRLIRYLTNFSPTI